MGLSIILYYVIKVKDDSERLKNLGKLDCICIIGVFPDGLRIFVTELFFSLASITQCLRYRNNKDLLSELVRLLPLVYQG